MEKSVVDFLGTLARDKQTLEMFRYLVNNATIRVVSYHNTKVSDIPRFEKEIAYFAKHFSPVTLADLDRFFETRKWHKEKPGLIPEIFEGYRTHYDVITPILEKYGLTGWYYIPSLFMDVPAEEQEAFCKANTLREKVHGTYPDDRISLTWDEVRALAAKHEICCHSGTHFRILRDTPQEDMQREIVFAKQHLEEKIDRPVDVFAWMGGREYSYNEPAQAYLHQAGYRYVVSNMKIEKIG